MFLSPLLNTHFSSYTKNRYEGSVTVYWYNQEFSQSRFPPGQNVSKACTLICLLVAQQISQTGLLLYDVEKSPEIITIIAEAMIKGNTIHACIIKKGLVSHPYLSTEEALKFGGKSLKLLREWTFRVFYEKIENCLYQNISHFLHKWYSAPRSKNLFMLLITCGRTILFIFQETTRMVTFFDSHSHSTAENPNRGLVIAQATIDKLEHLCKWYTEDILNKCYNTESNQYELAFLYPYKSPCCGCNSLCNCGSHCINHTHNM
ncbi:uncharacterized protein LOC143424206 [Xylocopa sonorina]|uniref:uncharacterized protein LOC143424206 n=1 Tax=Xylocopa sonorina TaxID=1818115 RepID=UPI00403B3358